MLRKITLSSVASIVLVSIVGCGGGGSSSSPDVQTGTGYYVDNAVAGVDYVCGSKTGKTDADGKFTFVEGKECRFTLAGIPLRSVEADELADGKKIVEDNPKVAKLLQSIDSDGDLSNGIQITDEVIEALTKALEETESAGKLPEGDTLTKVVADVAQEVAGVSGEVRTDEEVQKHLTQTQTEITKELLAGKTLYLVGRDTGIMFDKMVFNSDVTSVEMSGIDGQDKGETLTLGMTVNVDKMIFSDTPNKYRKIIDTKDKYLVMQEYKNGQVHGESVRLYYSKSDAQAYFDSLNGGSSSSNSLSASSLKAYFSGKKLYNADDDGVTTVVFNENATTLQFGSEEPFSITISDAKITSDDGELFIDEITDKYVKGHDSDEEFIFYVNRAYAQAEFENNYIVSDLVSGHVDFQGYDSVPSDAWVRIVPSVNKQHGNNEGPRCKIDSHGDFGTECYIDGDKKELKDKFNKSGETFQVVVYKNHVEPEGHHWNCGEDVYKYVGRNVNFNDWQNITVTLDDYQDRSDETCDD